MRRLLLALTVLPLSLAAAYNYSNQTDLWASTNDIPHYQAHQVGIQPNLKNTADFRPDKHGIPYIQWETVPSTAPAAPASGRPCIILISGGAYNALEDFSNPNSYQTWKSKLSALGIQCVHLFYRTPRPIGILREDGVTTNIYQSAWDDGQRAVRMIRSMAAEKNVDPNRIGVVGMSAGSHLATLLATSSQTPAYPLSADDVDKVSAEINVALTHSIAYGMSDGLTSSNKNGGNGATLDTVFKFDEKTCPMCMTHGGNDPYSPISSSMVWRRLDALGITAELHTYPDKTHTALGFDRHLEFLRKLGWLPSETAVAPDARWSDDSACGRISSTASAGGSLVWYHPAVHSTASVQIILKGAAADDSGVSAAITSARRYLNATGVTVVVAQVRADSAVDDARAALAAVKAEAAKHGLDAGYVGLMGFRSDANTAVEAATSSDSSVRAKWVVAVSPATGTADAPLSTIASNATPPTLFLHEGTDAANSPVGSVASWEKQRTVNVQGAVHTFGGEGADFISAVAVPGTGAYTYRERIRDFLSDKKFLATWTEPPPPPPMDNNAAVVTNRIDVSTGGDYPWPVVLHRDIYADYLADPDVFSIKTYSGSAATHVYDRPQIVELTWGDEGRSLVYTNLEIGAKVSYSVVKNDGTTLSGSFTTAADAPRTLSIFVANGKYIKNARDVGGWPLMGGIRSNQGVFFRGAEIDDFFHGEQLGTSFWSTRTDLMETVRSNNPMRTQLGIRTELDLRDTASGKDSHYTFATNGATMEEDLYRHNDKVTDYDWYPEGFHVGDTFTNSAAAVGMRLFLAPCSSYDIGIHKTNMVQRAFHVLGTPANHPVYFHCHVGRDRTGVIGLLINALIGADEETIYRDYLLTNMSNVNGFVNGSDVDQHIRRLLRGQVDSIGDWAKSNKDYSYGPSLAGHARAYLEHIGVTPEEIAAITQAMTGETPDEVLARVDAYETENEYVTVQMKVGNDVKAIHRIRKGTQPYAPVGVTATQTGALHTGWSVPELQSDGTYLSVPVFTPYRTVTFLDQFGGLVGTAQVLDGSAATELPSAPNGTRIVRCETDLSNVTADIAATLVLEGVADAEFAEGVGVTGIRDVSAAATFPAAAFGGNPGTLTVLCSPHADFTEALTFTSGTASAAGDFTIPLTGLTQSTTYYLRASPTDASDPRPACYAAFTTVETSAPVLSQATAEVSEDGTSATLRCALESLLAAPVEVVLELNGETVKTWEGLTQPAELTFDVSVVPASTNVFAFVATDAGGLTGSSSGGFVATVYTSWFTVDFDGDAAYVVGSPVTGVPSDRGTWSLAEGTSAELKSEGGVTVLAYGRADELSDVMPSVVYTPTEPSETGADVVVSGRVKVEACRGVAPSMADRGDSKGAFCFVKGKTVVPYGYTADGWRALSGGDEVVEGDFGEYTIRTVFSGTNGNEVAYAFEGWTGGPWPAADGTKSVTRVRFVREGSLGSFSGAYYSFLAGGDTPIEIVAPEFTADGSALAFGGAAGSEGATFSLTIGNPVKGAYYTVFTATTLEGPFTAEKASVLCDTTAATYTLTVDADAPSKFAKIVISLAPFAQGTPLPEK